MLTEIVTIQTSLCWPIKRNRPVLFRKDIIPLDPELAVSIFAYDPFGS